MTGVGIGLVETAEVHVRELVLEINGAVGQAVTPATVNNGGWFAGHRTGSPSWIRTNNMPVNSRPLYH